MSHAVRGHPRWLGHSGGFWHKHGPLEKGMANHFSILALRIPWTVGKGKKRTLKDELPKLVGAHYATREEWRNNSRKNEETELKRQQHPVVVVTGNGSKVWCCKEQYCMKWSEVKSFSRVRLFATPWTVAYRAPLSMGFSRQEYWSGLPFPSPGIEPGSPAL